MKFMRCNYFQANPVILMVIGLLCSSFVKGAGVDTSSITDNKFGKITIYMPKGTPTSVALFVSGDGGWKNGVINMAKDLAAQGGLVLGIDAKHYAAYLSRRTGDCLYPAADFEELSLSIQKKYKFQNYFKPVLVGYSYGAVLIYGILAQAPANTFKGAIALGFCPDIDLKKPLCKGSGLTQHVLKPGVSFYLERTEKLTAPFIVLNGVKDQTCPYEATEEFLKGMPMAELVRLDKVGHGFSIADHWLSELNAAYKKVTAATSVVDFKLVNNMPLTVVPATKRSDLPIVFMISGDGGWTSFDQSLAEALAAKGLAVVGLDAQKYFWNAKTPNGTTEDMMRAIFQYTAQMGNEKFILAGYSFGASVVPFVASRLPLTLKKHLQGIISLSPDESADFEIHIADMLNLGSSDDKYNVLAEFKKLKGIPAICYFGDSEDAKIRSKFTENGIRVGVLKGNHHFDDDFSLIAKEVLKVAVERK
ncbi:AcvB/VirJ family lysyl-phosphatidylglycerol hydrolase [Pedobacter frigoris]|uniref:AcvB/VirJ family lysyl-phosphatidylglycerol hydrolase n=1 Tax=Pedobacter frigoris TaxID=2571272 RepID=UPI002931E0E5|nr:AcvB/VirJ family lysyl-phosphatidylglycerol hydrolase [Pedobacter frigoris]